MPNVGVKPLPHARVVIDKGVALPADSSEVVVFSNIYITSVASIVVFVVAGCGNPRAFRYCLYFGLLMGKYHHVDRQPS
jgi:hypothetical protein